ncbi:E3 ISG15--protein ligase HERC5 [Anabarilius grahami]|uniref:E3 ISG15--protein ligase HERC5 n=1 Tax=Anabarilius grahami TaxID=495550 RepID=A0A3N0YJW6_ANAGA|nr:E3 ISG15--protein ligase HERC5 [Anabarilius grahami]
MLCYWGAQVREGFGLLQPDKVKHGKCGIRSMYPKSVEDMSAGRSFVGFIRDGKVSVLRLRDEGNNHDGKLKQLQLKKNDRIRSIVCGGAGAVLLANGGRVLIMDKSTMCRPLKGLENRQVIQIACGDQHSMALTKEGQLFVWGENSHGQLGLGKEELITLSPQPLKSMCGIPLAQISAGGDHSFVLSLSGVVFGWGKNSAGQLGLGDTTDRHVPTVVNSLNRKKTVSISCGGEHTATLSKGGTVFTFGSGGSGQLGHNSCKDEHHPRVVAELWGSKVSQELGNDSKLNPSRGILTFDDRMIDRWVSGSDSWKVIKKDINTVFSSAASLSGSFLKTSCDEHYQTSVEHCGLDFDLVKTSFAKLSNNERLISEGVKVVQQKLLPSLNPNPTGVESLRLYLLLPELISGLQEQQRTELTGALASKILDLSPDAHKVLETYWSKLPDDWLKNLVDLFQKVSAMLIGRIAVEKLNLDIATHLPKCVRILQMVYKVCCSAHRDITKSDFIIHEVNGLLDVLQTTNEDVNNNWQWFNLSGHINALMAQQSYYDVSTKDFWPYLICMHISDQGCLELTLRRTALLEDCFCQLRTVSQQHLRGFRLSVFYTEDMRRTDVNKRDFFLNVFQELCAPESQLLMYNDNKTLSWFPTQPSVEKEKYFLFGTLCGLAFNNNSVVNLPFPLALFKKLRNVKPSLEDLIEFSPVLGKSLRYILDYSDDVEEMELNFTISWDGTEVELDPAEPGKNVTNYNRIEFVDKYVDYILNKSVEEVFEEFKRGFFKACHRYLVEMFEPEELRGVLVGNEEYDWGILKQPDKVKHGKCDIRSVCPKSAVQDMSAGRNFVGFIRDGKVSVLRLRGEGRNYDGKLKQLQLKKNDRIRSIVCGGAGAVLLADGGRVLIMDKSTVCRPLKGLENRQVIQITCGDQHSMALTKDGQLFVWGENSHGQLGLKKEHPGSPSAQQVKSLCGIPLAQISAGGDHSFVLSLSGVVFGWGKNSAGQLGLGDTTDRHVPTVVNSLNRKKTVSISCGGEHTATLSKGGTVFTFGLGGSGQLGHNSFKDEHHPRVVAELWGSKVSQVTCGRNINKVFSSAASLNGGFLKTSCDEHYQTSEEHCGLNFDLVKTSFANLSENERLISEVVKVVYQTLLLSLNPNPAGVESLRLYLLLPELISGLQERKKTELTGALASKILDLSPDALKVLETYWSKLPDDWLKNLVDLFQKVSAMLIGRIAVENLNRDIATHLPKCVWILQIVYQVCYSAHRDITKSDFIIHEVNGLLDVLQTINEDMNNWQFNLPAQIKALKKQQSYYDVSTKDFWPYLICMHISDQLILRRTALLEDCFCQLRTATQQYLGGDLLSVFYTEDMRRTAVNKKDFFLNVFKELCAPESQLFMYNDNNTLSWFPTKPSVEKEKYFLFGTLCGLAFNNNSVVNLPFPLALFKKLLNVKPSLEDLIEFSPVLGKSLRYILDYSDDVEEMDMNFMVCLFGSCVIMCSNVAFKDIGSQTEFVDKYVDYILNKSVEEVFEEFKRGFFNSCDRCLVEMFEPEELRGVLVGNEEYDWDILKQNTTYEGLFYAEHPTIVSFWEVFDELTSNEKKAFLWFEKVPILGMSAVKMRVRPLFNSTQDHLPEALTCHALLGLPIYQSKKTLRAKVIEAINHKRGFWEE